MDPWLITGSNRVIGRSSEAGPAEVRGRLAGERHANGDALPW